MQWGKTIEQGKGKGVMIKIAWRPPSGYYGGGQRRWFSTGAGWEVVGVGGAKVEVKMTIRRRHI
jgi:hypothetical protein